MLVHSQPTSIGATSLRPRARLADIEALLRPPAWQKDALCREPRYRKLDWFPTSGGASHALQDNVCSRCLVRDECLALALADPWTIGIWAATTARERRAMRAVAA